MGKPRRLRRQAGRVDRFVANPPHSGRLTGRIDHPAFGQNVPVKRGTLELFFPSDNPTFKLITYGLTFEHEGQDYHLPGRKQVRNDPDFDLWSDTSTLYVLLHKNSDAARPVIGAAT